MFIEVVAIGFFGKTLRLYLVRIRSLIFDCVLSNRRRPSCVIQYREITFAKSDVATTSTSLLRRASNVNMFGATKFSKFKIMIRDRSYIFQVMKYMLTINRLLSLVF